MNVRFFFRAVTALFLGGCSPQTEQKILSAADVACALEAADPALTPTELQAAIAAACGQLPAIETIAKAEHKALRKAPPASSR